MNRPTIVAPFIAAALALSACSTGPAASPLDDARTQNQARHVAERFSWGPLGERLRACLGLAGAPATRGGEGVARRRHGTRLPQGGL